MIVTYTKTDGLPKKGPNIIELEGSSGTGHMKHYKFLGANRDELILEEMTFKFMVHKSLINDGTSDMIKRYIRSLREPLGTKVYRISDTYIFETAECSFSDVPDEYIPFAL